MSSVTGLLIAANVAVFILQLQHPDALMVGYALWPLGAHDIPDLGHVAFEPWQLVTLAILHGGFAHPFLNMFALWRFGRDCERALGAARALTFISTCTEGAAVLCDVYLNGESMKSSTR